MDSPILGHCYLKYDGQRWIAAAKHEHDLTGANVSTLPAETFLSKVAPQIVGYGLLRYAT
jgi:hypothetical protein